MTVGSGVAVGAALVGGAVVPPPEALDVHPS